MANSISLPASLPVKAIILADTQLRPLYEYQDGVRTDVQRTNDAGQKLFSAREIPATIAGQQDTITIQTTSEGVIQGGAIIAPGDDAVITVRATSSKGSSFASLAVTVFSEDWNTVGDLTDLI